MDDFENPLPPRPHFSKRVTLIRSPIVKQSTKVSIASADTAGPLEPSNSFDPQLEGFGHRNEGLRDLPEFQRVSVVMISNVRGAS